MMWGGGFVFVIICVALMAWMMMGHGGMMGHRDTEHSGMDHEGRREADEPERTLANRLASGEIDTDEYERLLETLRRSGSSTL
jgi:uncharacterized membrane protein